MKNILKCLPVTLFVASLLAIVSCNHKNEKVNPNPDDGGKGASLEYQRLMNARGNSDGVRFEILDVKLEQNDLYIKVKGGCSANDYKTVWNGLIFESYPQQIHLVVANESGNDSCDPKGEYTLKVDLKALLGDTFNPTDFVVTVSNGSKVQDKLVDEDGVVSSK